MNERDLLALLESVRSNDLNVEEALSRLKAGPFSTETLEFSELDHHRALRQGFGEVIYGLHKSKEQILDVAASLAARGKPVLITRANDEKRAVLKKQFPDARENVLAQTFLIHSPEEKASEEHWAREPFVALLAAGTSDAPVLEEAREVCVARGVALARVYDVGVAGLHRLLSKVSFLQRSTAIVVAAGMEGALPGVVAGLVSAPVFAVPTSVGYGANYGGLSALLTMLNTCAPGVSVVNIDNGFSAAFAACQVVEAVKRAKG